MTPISLHNSAIVKSRTPNLTVSGEPADRFSFLNQVFNDHKQSRGANRLKRYQVIILHAEGRKALEAYNKKETTADFVNPERKKNPERKIKDSGKDKQAPPPLFPKYHIFIDANGEGAYVCAKISKKKETDHLSGSSKHCGKGYLITILKSGKVFGQWIARMTLLNFNDRQGLSVLKKEIDILKWLAKEKIPNVCPLLMSKIYTSRNVEKAILIFPLLSCDLINFTDNCRKADINAGPYVPLIALKLIQALSACHLKGLMHSDLKLDNVLITHSPFLNGIPKITEVSLCDWGHADTVNARDYRFGTYVHFSPERLEKSKLNCHECPTLADEAWTAGSLLLSMLIDADLPSFHLLNAFGLISKILNLTPDSKLKYHQNCIIKVTEQLKAGGSIKPIASSAFDFQEKIGKLHQRFKDLNPLYPVLFIRPLQRVATDFAIQELQNLLNADFACLIDTLYAKLSAIKPEFFECINVKYNNSYFNLLIQELTFLTDALPDLIRKNLVSMDTLSGRLANLNKQIWKYVGLFHMQLRKSLEMPFRRKEEFPGHAASIALIKGLMRPSPKPMYQLLADFEADLARANVKPELTDWKVAMVASNNLSAPLEKKSAN